MPYEIMKKNAVLFCLFFTTFLFSQIEETPINFKKIVFVYETRSNYCIENQLVFADTLLFKIDFPNLKYEVTKNSSVSNNNKGYIKLSNFESDDLIKLRSILYHTNQKFIGEYNQKSDETIIKVIRDDELTKEIFKDVFKTNYKYFEYEIKLNYKKNRIQSKYPNVSYTYKLDQYSHSITYKTNTIGKYNEIINNIEYQNIIYLNEKLHSKIMPDDVFINNKVGIAEIKKTHSTTTLKSVSYTN